MPADSFESPLTLAACGGHVELAELLIQRGAAIEEVNDEGYTPLMEAAREGHEEMVKLLLKKGKMVSVLRYCLLYLITKLFFALIYLMLLLLLAQKPTTNAHCTCVLFET